MCILKRFLYKLNRTIENQEKSDMEEAYVKMLKEKHEMEKIEKKHMFSFHPILKDILK